MQKSPNRTVWPKSLGHLAYRNHPSSVVVIGELSSDPVFGFVGERSMYAVMVPLSELRRMSSRRGGISASLQSGCTGECGFLGWGCSGVFWTQGPRESRFESLVCSWDDGFNAVYEPSPALMKHFNLVPRHMKNGEVCWDDLSKPVRDVIKVRPHAHYEHGVWTPSARVEIRSDYLQRFLYEHECAAIEVYYEYRLSYNDPDFDSLLNKKGFLIEDRRGAHIELGKVDGKWFGNNNQKAEAWGSRLIVRPAASAMSDDSDPKLVWPGIGEVGSPNDATRRIGVMGEIFVADEVLKEYEGKSIFNIDPESGGVSYGNQWEIGDCRRVSRNYISVVLRKLYEGTPAEVVRHYHKFAVEELVAIQDERQNGKRSIGDRAYDLVKAYLWLSDRLADMTATLGLSYKGVDVGGFDSKDVRYKAWFHVEEFDSLGHVASMNMNRDDFLFRCLELQKLMERLNTTTLKNILRHIVLAEKRVSEFKQVRLLSTICQFAALSVEKDLSLSGDAETLRKLWDEKTELPILAPLFAINGLRNTAGHTTAAKDVNDYLQAFDIDPLSTVSGWGKALDRIYDKLTESFLDMASLLGNVR